MSKSLIELIDISEGIEAGQRDPKVKEASLSESLQTMHRLRDFNKDQQPIQEDVKQLRPKFSVQG